MLNPQTISKALTHNKNIGLVHVRIKRRDCHELTYINLQSLRLFDMTISEQLQRMCANTNRGISFIEGLNACIEFVAYANGNEEKECAKEMMREHLKTFDVNKMSVSEHNYHYILKLQKEYGVA